LEFRRHGKKKPCELFALKLSKSPIKQAYSGKISAPPRPQGGRPFRLKSTDLAYMFGTHSPGSAADSRDTTGKHWQTDAGQNYRSKVEG
jgi:hypothetical protein